MGHETGAIRKAKASLIFSMLVFGTIGIFVRYIPLPSSVIALTRGVIGTVFLIVVTLKRGPGISWKAIRRNLLNLCLSGAFIGINWILLFESYHFTTVATATLCYYMAPVFVTISAPFLFKERLTKKKMLCIAGALVGMIFVSGIWNTGISGTGELRGVLYGIGAAVFYASVILLNKKVRDISAYDKTMMQLAAAFHCIVALYGFNRKSVCSIPDAGGRDIIGGCRHFAYGDFLYPVFWFNEGAGGADNLPFLVISIRLWPFFYLRCFLKSRLELGELQERSWYWELL